IPGLLLIADAGGNHAVIAGEKVNDDWKNHWQKLSDHQVSLYLNNIKVCTGKGSSVMGNPLNSLKFAINEIIKMGKTIQKGEMISTGTMTGKQPVFKDDKILTDFGEFGKLQVIIK